MDKFHDFVTFFIPSHILGGLELLYIRCCIGLTKSGIKIGVIDYTDGVVSSELKNRNIVFIHILYSFDSNLNHLYNKEKNISIKKILLNDCVVILSLRHLPYASNFFTGNAKYLFWEEHPNNILGYLRSAWLYDYFFNILYKIVLRTKNYKRYNRFRKVMLAANLKDGVRFMFYSNYEIANDIFKLKITPKFIPIPIEFKHKIKESVSLITELNMNISYLGRIDKDKIHIVRYLIEDVLSYNKDNDYHVILHVIGDGSCAEALKKEIKDRNASNSIIFHGSLYGADLDALLLSTIEIAFGVGTSALESAILSVPTVLMSFDRRPNKNKYIWIFDEYRCELTLSKYSLKNNLNRVLSFNTIIYEYWNRKEEYTTKTLSYAKVNHSYDSVLEKLIEAVYGTTLTINDIN